MANTTCSNTNPLVCSRLTPAGRGAIAVVEIHGANAAEIIEKLFQPFNQRPFRKCLNRKMIYGTWTTTGEDVVVCNLSNRLEVHCHGGTAAVDSVVSALIENGVSEASPEAVQVATGIDLWRSEVWNALPLATTERTAALLLGQLERLPAAIDRVCEAISRSDAQAAIEIIDQLLTWADFGISLTQVPSVVLCGQPNVGKSSLINAIVGFQRAIVHSTAGTTRDVVTQRTAVDGWPIELSDTAGLRDAEGLVEEIGIQNARQKIAAARLVIGVFDGSKPWTESDQELLEQLACDMVVYNKMDQAPSFEDGNGATLKRAEGLFTSATENKGIGPLISQIAEKLVPQVPPDQAAYCVTPAAVERLQKVRWFLSIDQPLGQPQRAQAIALLSDSSV